jgi:hypothetical protein
VVGVPGVVIRFAKAWANKSSRLVFCAIGSPVPSAALALALALKPVPSAALGFPSHLYLSAEPSDTRAGRAPGASRLSTM